LRAPFELGHGHELQDAVFDVLGEGREGGRVVRIGSVGSMAAIERVGKERLSSLPPSLLPSFLTCSP